MRFSRLNLRALISAVPLVFLTGGVLAQTEQVSPENPFRVVLGMQPIGPLIPAFIGYEKGFFAEEGLEIEFRPEPGGQDIVTAVIAGEFNFGFSNQTSLLSARSKGLDVRAIASGTIGESDETSAVHGVLVRADSPLHTMADLDGKRVSVNTFNNAPHLTILRSLELAGIEKPLDQVEFIEVAFPDVVGVVSQGQIDAGWAVEPFLTIGKSNGLRTIANPLLDTAEAFPLSLYFTSGELIEQRPDVVDAFVRAINRSMAYASENTAEVRAAFPRFNNNVSAEIANTMDISLWTTSLTPQDLELGAELALKYGMINEIPDLEAFIYQPAQP